MFIYIKISKFTLESKMTKKKRCDFKDCKKKIKILDTLSNTCKCGQCFCRIHKFYLHHNCTFDYKTIGRKKLLETNIKVVAEKIIKI